LFDIERKIKELIENYSENQEKRAIEKIKTNPKYFYSYAKRKSKLKAKVGPFIINGKTITDNNEISETLNVQYQSMFSVPLQNKIVPDIRNFFEVNNEKDDDLLTDIIFTPEHIKDAINELKSNSAPGHEGFPAILLKNCKESLSYPLWLIFSKSLNEGVVPDTFKVGLITPIHKGGIKTTPVKYRPVSLTSHLIKIFERVLRKVMTEYLESRHKLSVTQHGFRSGRSTITQLLEHMDFLLENAGENNVDVIYLDFSKAFDKVDHGLLLHKLRDIGISGKLGCWIGDFLSGREQYVLANNCKSTSTSVTSGVPQGTVLGPLLFLIMVNDIDPKIPNCKILSFADDTKLGSVIKSQTDVIHFQRALLKVFEWCDINNMEMNPDKFEVMRYGKDATLKETKYTDLNNIKLEECSVVRDLGVKLDIDMSFATQINEVIIKSNNMISWIFRTFRSRSQKIMLPLFKSLVLPLIDYGSQLYYPYKIGDIIRLEQLQRNFTSKIEGMKNLDYHERLKELKLYSLHRRYERYTILYMYKIIENITSNFQSYPIETVSNDRTGRKIKLPKLGTKPGRTQTLQYNFFKSRAATVFNSLPRKLRDINGVRVEAFKLKLDKWLSSIPDEPRVEGYGATENSISRRDLRGLT
jgi:hypothetical protein